MPDLVNKYRIWVIRATAEVELERLTEISVDGTKDKTPVYTTGLRRTARGLRSGPIAVTGEFTFVIDAEGGNFQLPWIKMWREDEPFAIIGLRKGKLDDIGFEVLGCEISDVSDSHNAEDGESQFTVSWTGLDYNGED